MDLTRLGLPGVDINMPLSDENRCLTSPTESCSDATIHGCAGAVGRAFQKLVSDRDFIPLYQKWFMSRLPGGERLNIPMSAQLEQSLEVLRAGSEPN